MSEELTIVCPRCAFSKVVPESAIPDGARRVTCPKCGQAFPLNHETRLVRAPSEIPSAGMPPPCPPLSAMGEGSVPPPLPPQAPGLPPRAVARTLGFSFHGSASDYFGIWIVNTLLKILTFGIYSAWAKVRKRRFFFGSTTLQGEPFEYLADPMALFRGWLIAAAAFILYSIGTRISPVLSMVIGLVVFLAFPWLVVRSRIFNAVNSSHRNIRFGFRSDYKQAYLVFVGLPILTMLSFGLLAPYGLYRQKRFMVENSSYGSTPFSFTGTAKDFYLVFLKVALVVVVVFALIGLIAGISGGNPLSAVSAGSGIRALRGVALIPVILLPLIYFILIVYVQTAVANLSWNGTHIVGGNFRSTLRVRDMALLFVTNGLAIIFSLGLMVPWATIRLARYRFQHLKLETTEGLDNVVAAAGSGTDVGAAGDEIGDVFNMPIDIAM